MLLARRYKKFTMPPMSFGVPRYFRAVAFESPKHCRSTTFPERVGYLVESGASRFGSPPSRGVFRWARGASRAAEVLHRISAKATRRGLLSDDGLGALKGGGGCPANVPPIQSTTIERFRASPVEAGVMREEGEKVISERVRPFVSPSTAAVALLGRSSNGWESWKAKDGRTLDEVKRRRVGQ